MKKWVKGAFHRFGLDLVRYSPLNSNDQKIPHDLDEEFLALYRANQDLLGSFSLKLYTTYKLTEYLTLNNLPGDFIECGVYKGRQIVMMALTLLKLGIKDREIYLYDTFSGMTAPGEKDVKKHRPEVGTYKKNHEKWEQMQKEDHNLYCYAPEELVKKNVLATGYPEEKLHFIKGDVLKTIPNNHHQKVSFLRLDTDWYELTKHEFIHLFPHVIDNGIVSIDDYGSWQGAREAVDECIDNLSFKPLLFRTGTSERVFIKTSSSDTHEAE